MAEIRHELDKVRQILELRASGQVKRCHTNTHHGEYKIDSHVGQCLVLLFSLHPSPSMDLVKALTFHDHPELWTGDIPAPIKRYDPALKRELVRIESRYTAMRPMVHHGPLSLDEESWLMAIDRLEFYLWCRDQDLLGNQHATIMAEKVREWFAKDGVPREVAEFLDEESRLTWRERCFE